MLLSEYTMLRAKTLNKLNIPNIESPMNIKILWFESVDSVDIEKRIYTGVHAHSFCELHFVFSGAFTYECGGSITELTEGKAIFIPPDTQHRYVGCSDDLIKMSLAFSADDSDLLQFPSKTYVIFNFPDDISKNTDFILKHSEKSDIFAPSLISGRLLEIICSVCTSLDVELPKKRESETDPRFLVAKAFIEKNKHRIITCEDVAKECCISTKQLSRIFKSTADKSIFDYIIEVRVRYAKKLLQGDHSIKEISYMLGFDSESSFISFFKRHCGIPPGTFRKQKIDLPVQH